MVGDEAPAANLGKLDQRALRVFQLETGNDRDLGTLLSDGIAMAELQLLVQSAVQAPFDERRGLVGTCLTGWPRDRPATHGNQGGQRKMS